MRTDWILADFDDTLAPGDSHAGLLRYILRRRLWPLLLLPVIALGGLVYLVPSRRRQGISLIWWAITLGLSPLGWRKLVRAYCRTRPGLFREARALLMKDGDRCWVISASPRALVRGQLHQQLPGKLPHRTLGSRMHYRLGGLMPRFYLLPRPAQDTARGTRPRCGTQLERQPARSAAAGAGRRGLAHQSHPESHAKSTGALAPHSAQTVATVRQS